MPALPFSDCIHHTNTGKKPFTLAAVGWVAMASAQNRLHKYLAPVASPALAQRALLLGLQVIGVVVTQNMLQLVVLYLED